MRTRWQPTRAGLLNVWRYFDEVLTFADGRLLLRGRNGSGKSKALELLLPFLLDANQRASRLSTFGSGDRTMHWNLMGQGASGATRVGYVWLELGRGGPNGDEFVTIGARLQASKSDHGVRTVYFVVSARAGFDLNLQPDREPLTVAALKAAVSGRGDVYESDTAGYRARVRALFFPGMEAERYDSLIQALLQLRRPKLSERLDPENLSSYLSSALPPIDATRIEELAEGFERLDQRRAELAALTDEVRAARSLLETTRTYGSVLLRERAKAVTAAATDVDTTSRSLRTAMDEHVSAQANEEATEQRHAEVASEIEQITAERSALQDSDAYREGRDLEDLRAKARQSSTVAERSRSDAQTAHSREERLQNKAAQASHEAIRLSQLEERAYAEVFRTAQGLGIEALVGTDDLLARVEIMTGHVREVTELVDGLNRVVHEREQHEAARTRAKERLAEAACALDDAQAQAVVQEERHIEEVLAWARSCTELGIDERAVLTALDEDGLTGHVQEAAYDRRRLLERLRDEHERQRSQAAAEADSLAEERERLAAQPEVAPEPWRFRSGPERSGAGARLWQVVDFHDDVPDVDRAGIEAALESSGLLDGWLDAVGALQPVGHDTVIVPGAPVDGTRLSDVLRPDVPASIAVPAAAVAAVLDTVALRSAGDGATTPSAHSWIASDGSWRLGVARGVWSKPTAEYVGAAARERHRLGRLAVLDAQITGQTEIAAQHSAAVAHSDARMAKLAEDVGSVPSAAALTVARRAIDAAALLHAERERVEADASEAVRQAQDAVRAAHDRLVAAADARGLPAAWHELESISVDLAALRDQERSRQQAHTEAASAREREEEATAEAETASTDTMHRETRAEADERSAREDRIRLHTLEDRLGGAYADLVSQLDTLTAQLDDTRHREKRLAADVVEAVKKTARLGEAILAAEALHRSSLTNRDEASRALVALHRTTLAADAGVTEPLPADAGVTAVLDEARRLDRALPATRSNDNSQLAQNRMYQRAHDTADKLARRAHLSLEPDGNVVVPVATVPGRRLGVAELLRMVENEAAQAREEITEGEHDLFERALTGDTRRHLSQTIREASELVGRMNERLKTVQTDSGVQVRLTWDVRDEEGSRLRSARDLLLQNPGRLTEAEHDALHTFFRERIDAAHNQDAGRSWAQQLATVFDYTQWHRFRAQLFRPDGDGWRTLTQRVHSVLSGGEKAIALHLPLFAALAAHYEASPDSPRFILLDEVFVGIDEGNRGQIFALLRDLDLDLVLTSDHEWATYAEVPAIAIHALAAGTDHEAVTTTRFVWSGGQLAQDDTPFEEDAFNNPEAALS
jgi:hypothetical protein